jgi:hypothetical protein
LALAEFGTALDADNIHHSTAVDGRAELSAYHSRCCFFEVGTQRELESKLLHIGSIRARVSKPLCAVSVVSVLATTRSQPRLFASLASRAASHSEQPLEPSLVADHENDKYSEESE